MTTQAAPSFDAEYARVVKAVETAQARGDDFEQIVNACMEALKLAGITNDAPLDQLVARLARERDEAQREAEYWRGENRATRDAAARTMEEALMFIAPAAVIECERNNLKARVSSNHAAALQTQLEETQRERDEARTERDTAESRRTAAAMDASTSVRLMEKARARLEETQRECARLLTIVGTETSIAAFDLVTTWRAEKQAYMDRIAELESDLARCAAAHQKAIEQTAHYGAALTELAITGNETANTALGTAPYEDSTRATYRNLTTACRWAQLWKRGAQAQMRACGYWKDEARRAAEALRAQTAAANAEQGRLADLVLRTGHECAELTRELAALRAAHAAQLAKDGHA